jgi:hypothetical protein
MAKTQTRKNDSTVTIGFEAKLWLTADKLRNNMDAAEYKHVASASSSSNTSPTPSRSSAPRSHAVF